MRDEDAMILLVIVLIAVMIAAMMLLGSEGML